MFLTYVVVTSVVAIMTGWAAAMNFLGAASVIAVADRLHMSRRWMVPLGILLTSGAVGLLLGMAVPALGIAAAVGLIVYFSCAVAAHLRACDRKLGGALLFLLLAAAALVADGSYRSLW